MCVENNPLEPCSRTVPLYKYKTFEIVEINFIVQSTLYKKNRESKSTFFVYLRACF